MCSMESKQQAGLVSIIRNIIHAISLFLYIVNVISVILSQSDALRSIENLFSFRLVRERVSGDWSETLLTTL